ncbi:MAG: hypothetical protein K0U45_06660 [Alphaproteobacteria bacterium]|nr:hypothetical protein [Alphaproteobacteria bacterium]
MAYIYLANIAKLIFGKKISYFIDNNFKRLLILLNSYQRRILSISPLLDKEADFIIGYENFKYHNYHDAIDFFAASIAKGALTTISKLLMIKSMLMVGRLADAEQHLNQFESHSACLSREIAFIKVTLSIARGDYQRAFVALDKRMDKDKKHATYWCHAYLAKALGKEEMMTLPEAFRNRAKAATSPQQINLAQINLAQINLALLDYKSVDYDKVSGNIGDYIQTVAVMRHIARHLPDDALIDGDANSNWQIDSKALKSSLAYLRELWSENERRHITSSGKIVIADRDCPWNLTAPQENNQASNKNAENNTPIWLPIFGWFAYKPFDIMPVFPLSSQYLPIFFSFHLQYPQHLDKACIAYLKRFAPIGCRDIATRDLLMNQGIDAFFSGCVTTTLALEGDIDQSGETLAVDVESEADAIHITQDYPAVKARFFDENITESLLLLRRFRNAKQVITSRLHCYLPTRALSGDARFIHKNKADTRFDGLIDIDDEAFDTIRDGLTDLLDKILGKIMAGDSSADEVYAYWRELTMPLMEKTRREREQYKPFFVKGNKPAKKSDIQKPDIKKKEVPIALAFDANIADYVPALINSIEANTSCATRYIMLVRDLPDDKIKPIEKACKQAPIQWIAMDKFLKGETLNWYGYITISALDRLFLPELLSDIDKILYLDIDMIVQGDVAELYQTELCNAPLAARENILFSATIHTEDLHHLPIDKLLALRKSASVSLNLLSPHFNSGVLVASLEKMRQDNFTEQVAHFATHYQLSDQHILNFYTADNCVKLSPVWNGFPNWEKLSINQQKIFHWAGVEKPWHAHRNAPFKHVWQKYANMQD